MVHRSEKECEENPVPFARREALLFLFADQNLWLRFSKAKESEGCRNFELPSEWSLHISCVPIN